MLGSSRCFWCARGSPARFRNCSPRKKTRRPILARTNRSERCKLSIASPLARGLATSSRSWQWDSNIVELRNGQTRTLPFSIRCDTAGQENYQDGSPKKWWSKLAVVQGGKDVQKKEIVVNDPLLYSGVRFYQSSFGPNGKVEKFLLDAAPSDNSGKVQQIGLALNDTLALDSDTTVRFAAFFPDFAVRDGQVYLKSNELENPAVHLIVTSRKAGKDFDVWFPKLDEVADNSKSPYQFHATDLKMAHFTGLQVSHEPGQWAVWSGVVLLGVGLAFVFYVVHMRFWAVPVCDPD